MKKLFEEFPPVPPGDWEKEITKDLKGKDISTLDWKPYEGFTVKPFYTAGDMDGLEYLTDAAPGEFPFVRGVAGGRNPWRIDERITAPSPSEANKLALNAIANGVRLRGNGRHNFGHTRQDSFGHVEAPQEDTARRGRR